MHRELQVVTDAFEEVEESLREEKAAAFWKRAQPFLFSGALLLIGGVAVHEFWQSRTQAAQSARAAQFQTAITAIAENNFAGAKPALDAMRAGDDGFAALSSHLMAGLEQELGQDNVEAATPLIDLAAARSDIQADVALIKAGYLKADTLSLAELKLLLAPVLERGGAPATLGRELVAAKTLADGNVAEAHALYAALSLDVDAPRGVQLRAGQILQFLPASPPAAPAPEPASTSPQPQPAQ